MSTETWGTMPKSQIDPEVPEEMALRVVQEHDDDPDAHLDAGQSLTSHRAMEIMDHLARSVVGDKINNLNDAWENLESGAITSYTASSITDSTKVWATNAYKGHYILVFNGNAPGSARLITSNDSNTITYTGTQIFPTTAGMTFIITLFKYSADVSFRDKHTNSYNNRIVEMTEADMYVEYTFSGSQIALYGEYGIDSGEIEIYIDGDLKETIILEQSVGMERWKIWEYFFDTTGEHTIKVVLTDYVVGGGDQGIFYFNAFDVNGVVKFTSLELPIYAIAQEFTVNANGFWEGQFNPPSGYSGLLILGYSITGQNNLLLATPKINWYPRATGFWVIADDATAGGTFTISLQMMVYEKDPYVGN